MSARASRARAVSRDSGPRSCSPSGTDPRAAPVGPARGASCAGDWRSACSWRPCFTPAASTTTARSVSRNSCFAASHSASALAAGVRRLASRAFSSLSRYFEPASSRYSCTACLIAASGCSGFCTSRSASDLRYGPGSGRSPLPASPPAAAGVPATSGAAAARPVPAAETVAAGARPAAPARLSANGSYSGDFSAATSSRSQARPLSGSARANSSSAPATDFAWSRHSRPTSASFCSIPLASVHQSGGGFSFPRRARASATPDRSASSLAVRAASENPAR